MNETPLRKFCESRHRKLIVVIVTTLFGLLVLIPLVDDYFDKRTSHTTLTEDLDRARQTVAGLPEIEEQVSELNNKLAAIEARAVNKETVSKYRNKIVELVRESNCKVRRFDVGSPTRRRWLENDNPLSSASKDTKQRKTPFTLETRSVVLLVDGPMENIRSLLNQLHRDDSFAYLNHLVLQSGTRGNDQVTLEIEMKLFALGRQKV